MPFAGLNGLFSEAEAAWGRLAGLLRVVSPEVSCPLSTSAAHSSLMYGWSDAEWLTLQLGRSG